MVLGLEFRFLELKFRVWVFIFGVLGLCVEFGVCDWKFWSLRCLFWGFEFEVWSFNLWVWNIWFFGNLRFDSFVLCFPD